MPNQSHANLDAILGVLLEHRTESMKQWAAVSDRMGLMEDSISSVSSDIADVKTDVAEVKADVGALKTDVGGVKTDMAENTEMTRVMADAKTAGRVFTKVVGWAGTIALAVGSIIWAFKEVLGRNHNITPGP
jgi:uncharacterized protein (UPF0335 family)